MSTTDAGMGLVLLDQCHVDVRVPADMDDPEAEGLWDRIGASLRR
jgi:hypothetical protein